MEKLKIEAYSLLEFSQKIQDAVQDGWLMDFATNEGVPSSFGSLHEVIMVKAAADTTGKRKSNKQSD